MFRKACLPDIRYKDTKTGRVWTEYTKSEHKIQK